MMSEYHISLPRLLSSTLCATDIFRRGHWAWYGGLCTVWKDIPFWSFFLCPRRQQEEVCKLWVCGWLDEVHHPRSQCFTVWQDCVVAKPLQGGPASALRETWWLMKSTGKGPVLRESSGFLVVRMGGTLGFCEYD